MDPNKRGRRPYWRTLSMAALLPCSPKIERSDAEGEANHMMDLLNRYQAHVKRHAKDQANSVDYVILGLAGETGEVCELWKKHHHRKDPRFTKDQILEELGDVLWYLTRLAWLQGWSLDEVMETNIEKLNRRHPNALLKEDQ